MRINEILIEQQLNEMHMLQEGPLGSALGAVGRGVGKAVGGVAKGVGAVAGGIAGIGGALKKGFQAGKATVSGDNAGASGTTSTAGAGGTATPPAAGAGGTATPPAAGAGGTATPPVAGAGGAATPPVAGAGGTATPPAAGAGGAAGGTATPPAAGAGGAATPPAAGAAPDASSKADPVYDKAQKAVQALPPEQKKEIIGLLQADPKVKAAMAAKPSTQGKKGVSQPGKPTFTGVPEKPAATTQPAAQIVGKGGSKFDQATGKPFTSQADADAQDDEREAFAKAQAAGAAPAVDPGAGAATPPAAGAAKPARTGGKVAGQVSQTPGAIAKRAARADKKKPAGVGLDMNLLKAAQQNASRVNHGNALSEMLARGVAQHKQQMFETALVNGTQSIFRKK